MNRTLSVMRMQFVNKYTFVWLPLIILGASLALSVLIFAMIPYDGGKYGGGSQAPIWYFFALGITSLSYTFPFSQALSLTRREFFFGTMLAAAVTALILAVAFVLGGAIEVATGGWGVNGYFFYLDWVWQSGWLVAGLFFGILSLMLFVIGFWGATLYRRFGALGLTLTLVAFGVVLVIAMFLVQQLDAWGTVFEWFAALGAGGLALGMAGATVVFGVVAWATLRRATP